MSASCVPFPLPARQLDQNPCAATIACKKCKNGAGLRASKKAKFSSFAPALFLHGRRCGNESGIFCRKTSCRGSSMEISGYGSIFFSQEAEESARAARGKNNGQEGSALGLPGGSDTVSISEEARKLSEKMLLEKQEEQRRQEQEQSRQSSAAPAGNGPAADNAEQQGAAEAGGSAGASGSGGSSSADQIQSIREKIRQLEARLQSIASSSLPENVKASQMNVLQAQVNDLQQQLNAMAQQAA